MSKKIAIVGAGQSGLMIGIALQKKGYRVTLVSNRSAEELKNGKVLSSQCMFHNAVENERAIGIDYWSHTCPPVNGIGLVVPHPEQPGQKLISWSARLNHSAYAVDQRVKMPVWMNEFERLGGELILKEADVAYLETLASANDLVMLAAGKGDLVKLFERDAEKSMFDKPQRALALTYVEGMKPTPNYSQVSFNLIPTVGEYFVFPALTTTGACDIMVFEGVPGGPMDCWKEVKTPQQHLAKSLEILKTFLPWEYERSANCTLTDDNGILSGTFPPTIRKPILTLPSGKPVLGVADVVVLNDPITGQGSNNASKCSKIYIDSILANGDKPYSREWMQKTFDAYWSYAANVCLWTGTLLGAPPPHILNVLGAAGQIPSLASKLANGFNEPQDFFPWWLNPDLSEALIKEHTSKIKEHVSQ